MDRERVIEALQYLISGECTDTQFDYIDEIEAAIALLKEQEPVVRCRDCKHGEKVNSVYLCGKSRGFGLVHEPDWFCADGERREQE